MAFNRRWKAVTCVVFIVLSCSLYYSGQHYVENFTQVKDLQHTKMVTKSFTQVKDLQHYEVVTKHTILRKNDRWILTADTGLSTAYIEDTTEWSVLRMLSNQRCGLFPEQKLENLVLKAIQSEARFIFVASHVTKEMLHTLGRFHYEHHMPAIRYSGNLQDPVAFHFAFQNITGMKRPVSLEYQLGVWKTALVQKLLLPHRPEVEHSNDRAPILLLPFEKLHPFTNNNILFHYDAFWSIVPLIKDQAIWSIWVQKIMQEVGSYASFSSVDVARVSDCREIQHSDKEIKNELNIWQCQNRASLFSCILALSKFMLDKHYISQQEYTSISNWLEKLLQTGYKPPTLMSRVIGNNSLEEIYNVLYHPTFKPTKEDLNFKFKSTCNKGVASCPANVNTGSFKPYHNILLLIVFNKAGHYATLEYTDKIYRPYFKYILYCGQDIPNMLPSYNKLRTPVSFIQVDQKTFSGGELGYQCLQKAILMNYDVEGYLHIGDDVLLNIWNLYDLPTDKMWFQQSLRTANLSQPTVPDVWRAPTWWPWNSAKGRVAISKAINSVRNLSKTDPMAKSFLDQLAKNGGGEDRVFYEVSDIFYISSKYTKPVLYFLNLFLKHNGYLEITIPTIIAGVVDQKDIVRLPGSYLWYDDRKLYRETFNVSNIFLHSLKLGKCFPDKTCTTFLCDRYLPCLSDLKTL